MPKCKTCGKETYNETKEATGYCSRKCKGLSPNIKPMMGKPTQGLKPKYKRF